MSERRFTDREVARILQRATELDRDQEAPATGRGLTLAQLREVGAEAGIPPDLVSRAAGELERRALPRPTTLLGSPLAKRQTRSIPASLPREAMARLVRTVDERVPAQGTAVEALGSVRWTSQDRFLSRQIALEPTENETLIRVEERYDARLRVLLHVIPAAYGAMFGGVLATESMGGTFGVVGGVVITLLAWLLGRMAWEVVAGRSGARVHDLAEALTEEASRLAATTPGTEEAAET